MVFYEITKIAITPLNSKSASHGNWNPFPQSITITTGRVSMDEQLPDFSVGTQFPTLNHLKTACRKYAVLNAFEFKVKRATKTRYEIVCKSEHCPWRLYAKPVDGCNIFSIQVYQTEHTCFGINHSGHRNATASLIANVIAEKVKQQPTYRPIEIQRDIHRELGVKITYSQAHRGRDTTLTQANGSHEDAYRLLPNYFRDIERTNPGSLAILESTSQNKFQRVFISYGASAAGLSHCRPLLGLDGTHLKTRYQGTFF